MIVKSICLLLAITLCQSLQEHHKYCIVGAGPGGLQMAHFLQRANKEYVLFERTNVPGSFYHVFPRHRMLISINKRNTGFTNTEFNFRHDWNSILSDDESLRFTKYSKEFFPPADLITKYLSDYVDKLNLTVRYEHTMQNLRPNPDGVGHLMEDTKGNEFSCRVVVLATGLSKALVPDFEGRELCDEYTTMNIDPEFYEGKSVLIVGRGNTGFEIAQSLYGNTNLVHMVARSRVKLSWETHYVGDVRGINNALLDTYQLKSLDGILEYPMEEARVVRHRGGLYVIRKETKSLHDELDEEDNYALRYPYDHIILATGFTFDNNIFNSSHLPPELEGKARKYPNIRSSFDLADREDIFVVGTASHSLDFRKSAGGFIHGFRYTGRAVFRQMMWRYEGVPWPSVRLDLPSLLPYLQRRMNEGSGNYQMFGVLCDLIIPQEDGLHSLFLEEFQLRSLPRLYEITGHRVTRGIIVSLFEYGAKFSGPGKDIFRSNRAEGDPAEAHKSNFLHPTLYYYDQLPTEEDFTSRSDKWQVLPKPKHLLHLVEDFTTFWNGAVTHTLPLRRFLERALGVQLQARSDEQCFRAAMSFSEAPHYCRTRYLNQREMPSSAV